MSSCLHKETAKPKVFNVELHRRSRRGPLAAAAAAAAGATLGGGTGAAAAAAAPLATNQVRSVDDV